MSFHRVWWRRHWVLWFNEPYEFEKHRPWSHHRSAQLTLATTIAAAAALWILTLCLASFPLALAAVGVSAVMVGLLIAVVRAELRFWAWWRGNDDRTALDAFRRPARLDQRVAESRAALVAVGKAGDPSGLVVEFALEYSRKLRGWRSYRTPGWVRLTDIAPMRPLVQLHDALDRWREINEAWSEQEQWEADFAGVPVRRGLLDRLLSRSRSSDPIEKSAEQVSVAARGVRAALEHAAADGLRRVRQHPEHRDVHDQDHQSERPYVAPGERAVRLIAGGVMLSFIVICCLAVVSGIDLLAGVGSTPKPSTTASQSDERVHDIFINEANEDTAPGPAAADHAPESVLPDIEAKLDPAIMGAISSFLDDWSGVIWGILLLSGLALMFVLANRW